MAFRVTPPWHKTPWAYGLASVVALLIAFVLTVLIVRWRLGIVRRLNLDLETELRSSSKEIEKLTEELQGANKLLEDET